MRTQVSDAACTMGQLRKYDLAMDQKASYEYDIQIYASDNLITYTGIVNYNVTLTNDQPVRLNFQGGLTEQTKPKANRGDRATRISWWFEEISQIQSSD